MEVPGGRLRILDAEGLVLVFPQLIADVQQRKVDMLLLHQLDGLLCGLDTDQLAGIDLFPALCHGLFPCQHQYLQFFLRGEEADDLLPGLFQLHPDAYPLQTADAGAALFCGQKPQKLIKLIVKEGFRSAPDGSGIRAAAFGQ